MRDSVLILLGRLAALPDAQLQAAALTTLVAVVRSEAAPALLLRAAEAVAAHIGALPQEARAKLLETPPGQPAGRLLDRLINNAGSSGNSGSSGSIGHFGAGSERWVRLGALEVAGRPGGAALVSTAALQRAAEDNDGFVREAALRLLKTAGPAGLGGALH